MTTTLQGFELLRETEIPEINTRAKLYRHGRTGAQLLALVNDDENKVFGVSFRTPTADSTGVPHIIEHSVLGGSRKYPVKEPFKELVKGSLKTFLNAMTYPDKTVYPVASTNTQDFFNLMDVYLDAVFYPRLTPEHLQQEGWHYELNDPSQPLAYRGIVFNEMKGAYSSPERIMYVRSRQSLFPDTIYVHDSGGDPASIPDLTYEQFHRYYQTYYHPSNALVYVYGDVDVDEVLRRVDEYLRDFDRRDVESAVGAQRPFDRPRRVTYPYAVGPDTDLKKKSMVTVNWLLDETSDFATVLTYGILEEILIGTPASPLRKALIDSGLGEELAGVGLDDSLRQLYFSVGLKGISTEDADKVEHLIFQTLNDLARNGIDPATVRSAMNTTEFRLRENNTGSYPRGLSLMLRSLSTWLHGDDPVAPLAFEKPLNSIKERLSAGERYFEGLIERAFLNNAHRTTVILLPDPELTRRNEAAETERLERVRDGMKEEDLAAVIEATRRLKVLQETPDSPEALATIPRLKLSDLERQNKHVPREVLRRADTEVLYHDIFTNGITYLDVGFNLHALPQELLPYAHLFGRALVEMGTDREDYVKLSQRIGSQTGGIRPVLLTSAIHGRPEERPATAAWLFLRGKAMLGQTSELLNILRDVLLRVRLDNQERFRQMVLEEKARLEAALVPQGHGFVHGRLGAHFGEANWAAEQTGGIAYLFFVRELARAVEQDWRRVIGSLEEVRETLLTREAMLCNVTLDENSWDQVAPQLDAFLGELPRDVAHATAWKPEAFPSNEGLTLPGAVNYVGKGINLYDLGYRLDGSALVATRYLSRTWLWDRVRVVGGAYGGFCRFDYRSGLFAYLSYRDPNLLQTLEAYDQAARFLREGELTEDEVTKAIIGTISDIDAYLLPDAKGWVSLERFLARETDEFRQELRDEVLSTTIADFRAFADVLSGINDRGHVVVLGSQVAIEAANSARSGWLTITNVGL